MSANKISLSQECKIAI